MSEENSNPDPGAAPGSPPPQSPPPAAPPSAGPPAAPPAAPPQGDSWLDRISDQNARALVEAKKYKSENDVAVAYYNLTQLHRGSPNVVAVPEADDTEGWNTLFGRLGRPDSPENYSYSAPEGVEPDKDFLSSMQKAAHEAGISQAQFEKLAKANDAFIQEFTAKSTQERQAENQRSYAELEKAFGGEKAFNEAAAAGQRAVQAIGLDAETLDALDDAAGNLAVQKLMATLGQKIGKETDFLEGVDVQGNGQTPQQAKVEMDRLKEDDDFTGSLTNPGHANHRSNLAKWQELQRVAFQRVKK